MLVIKYLLIASAVGLLTSAATVLAIDAYRSVCSLVPPPFRWRLAARLALLAWLPLLPALSIVVVPSGTAGIRVSQISGTLAGTMYPGTHFIVPLIHHVELYTVRDQIIAERLSDKVQIMMVPTDGKFFFANDVLKGSPMGSAVSLQSER